MKRRATSTAFNILTHRRLAVLALALAAAGAQAQISGFNSGANYTLNDNGAGAASFPSSQTLMLTNNTYGDAVSVFYNTQQSVSAFNASFTYQLSSNVLNDGLSPADGFTFELQADGLNQLGIAGGALGYGTPSPDSSVAVAFNVYNENVIGTNLYTQGNATSQYMSTGSVNLASFDPIAVSLIYDGSTLTESLTDTVTSQNFTTSYAVNIPAELGQSMGWAGFTAGTGSGTSIQTISDFQYNAVPEPSSLFALGIPAIALLGRRSRNR